MPQEEHLTIYRDGTLGRTLIEAVDELIVVGRFPILPGAVRDHPISLPDSDPAGSEATDPIDLTGTPAKTTNTTDSSSPSTATNNSSSPGASSSTAPTSPINGSDTFTNTNIPSTPPSSPPVAPTTTKPSTSEQQQQQPSQIFNPAVTQKLTTSLLTHFDRVIAQTLATHDDVVKKAPPIKMKGKLESYRNVDDIWKMWVKDVEMVVGDVKRKRKPRPSKAKGAKGAKATKEGGTNGKRTRDEVGDGQEKDGEGEGEERAGKRRKGDAGEAQAVVDGEEGNGVIKIEKLLIIACNGKGEGEDWRKKKNKK
ncbi:hypothetical protein B0T20DRAFT_450310 [Sordaria brevicollis]|uniref:Uncharacterized protein n=1 Tax=Sordaria brevicollis TaxID=83679 RepID=A0AAE0UGP1_SORBR|nr:hypothetical protein B0T20DRAFT_450310 [Sordaria brevicollis]